MTELKFENVAVSYGTGSSVFRAVDGINLTVPSGKVVGLVGESGSGKSTLARAAVGLTAMSDGRILLGGQPLNHRGRGRNTKSLQMVFQDPYSSLDPRMTIGDSVAESIPKGTVAGAAGRRAEVARTLELVGIDADRADSLPTNLSGGQRQRVALARALAGRPEVIIADEITSALDVSIQGTVLNLLRDIQQQMNLSMLFISHNLAVVRYVSDVIAVMYLGRIVECGPASEVLSNPQHPYTQELLAATEPITTPKDRAGGSADAVADVEPADPHHPPGGCRFHPRCPVGPVAIAGHEICREIDPSALLIGGDHSAACHFPQRSTSAIKLREGARP